MIIFDLDGTLANRDHRLHFIDPWRNPEYEFKTIRMSNGNPYNEGRWQKKDGGPFFKPDYEAFEDACDKDTPNEAVIKVLRRLLRFKDEIQIWSGRSERVREKTKLWLMEPMRVLAASLFDAQKHLKMRPIGDYTLAAQLKERWLDEALADGKKVEMVFEDGPRCVGMWRRRGIPCFQVAEGDF